MIKSPIGLRVPRPPRGARRHDNVIGLLEKVFGRSLSPQPLARPGRAGSELLEALARPTG